MSKAYSQDPSSSPLEEENIRLKRAVEELSLLNDLARAIGALSDSSEIMDTIVRKSLRAVRADQGVITLTKPDPGHPGTTLIRAMVTSAGQTAFHFQQALMGWMYLNKKPLLVKDPRADQRFQGVQWDESIQSLLAAPLMVKSELKGVLTVYNKPGGFTEDDQRLLAIIATQSAQVVENARLSEEEKALITIREEIRLASKIQQELLPREMPNLAGYDIAARMAPAQLCGGDYYDFIPLGEGKVALALGDVTGKGLPASLLMANLQATLRGQTHAAASPSDCLRRSNRFLHQSTSPDKFATLFYGVLDGSSHILTYCNAGHDHPVLFHSDGTIERLGAGGLMLGALDDFPFEEGKVDVKPGAVFVVYSDGITEAWNTAEEMFGEERLLETLRRALGLSAREIIDRLFSTVRQHAGAAEQSDDMTVLVMKRTPNR